MCTEVIKDIMHGIFIVPLTAGHKSQLQQNGDCKISSTIIVVIWLAVMLVLIPGIFQTGHSYDKSTPFIVHIALDLNLVLAIIGCIGILLKIAFNDIGSKETPRGERCALTMRIFFLLIFLLGLLIDSGSDIWKDTLCLNKIPANGTWEYASITSNISYNVLLVIFCALETVCILIISLYNLKKTAAVKFCIITMIGGNISIWVNTFNQMYQNDTHDNSNNSLMVFNDTNFCFSNITDNKNKEIARLLHSAGPSLQSTVLQFVFLSLYMMFEKWSSLLLYECGAVSANTFQNEYSSFEDHIAEHEITPLFENNFSLRRNNDTDECSYNFTFVAVSLGVLFAVVLSLMCIFGVTDIFSENKRYQYWFNMLICIYKVIMMFVFYICFFTTKNNITADRSYNAREIIMLIGVFFNFQYFTYQFIATLLANGQPFGKFIACFFNITFEYIQIVCILQLNFMELSNQIRWRYTKLLKACVGFSMVMILGFWFVDCFMPVGRYHVTNDVVVDGLGEDAFHLIKFLIFPMFVFYRFTVFFAYANLYQNL